MKRILLLTVLALSFVSVNAQIKLGQTFANDLIIIGNLSDGQVQNAILALNGYKPIIQEHKLYCRIFKDKVTYGILVDTQNRFDDDFEFALGTDMEKAKESLRMILLFMDSTPLGTSQTATDEDDRVIQLNLEKRNSLTLEVLDAQGKIICDKVTLSKHHLERAFKLLNKKAEKKVAKAYARNNEGL